MSNNTEANLSFYSANDFDRDFLYQFLIWRLRVAQPRFVGFETFMPVTLERYDTLGRHADRQSTDAILSIDAAVVGTISAVGPRYKADTKGLVPILDGITGSSIGDVWSKIEELVDLGQVRLSKLVTGCASSIDPDQGSPAKRASIA